ncbi:M1 family metallopeptidase [Streptomyces gamaensis]|uniref:Aminopeptidase N n=1 Tax=Streptomyces gamaensis TaxID=1763542 RepID=A0ABW0Z8Q5_9ACTN
MPHSPRAHRPRPLRHGRGRAVPTATALAALAALLLGAGLPPSAGPEGIGDRLFPELGNPGYHVAAYDISFDYHGNDRPLDAVTKIEARATGRLEHFNLDFAGGTVRSVEVNGRQARFTPVKEDLAVVPAAPLPAGGRFTVVVRHTSEPRAGRDGGWVTTADGLVMANQADAAHRVFPCNDHPSDKAPFTFRVTVPNGLTAVANGLPEGHVSSGATSTWTYRTRHPMATEVAQVAIGRSAVTRHTGPHALPLRDVVPAAQQQALKQWTAKTSGQVSWLEQRVGAYPFENYGVLMADASTGFELETQTLSLFERSLFARTDIPAWYLESIMVHELSHQWFGDSLSPRTWSDLWLNEGHATWYEALYAQERGGRSLEDRMKLAYRQSDTWRADGGPPALPKVPDPGRKISIFRPVVYDGGALVLYALRQRIGVPAFERLEREWSERHRDAVVSTADFVAEASRVAGQDLTGFLRPWLYDPVTPPMPGHPDWRAAPRKPA